MRMNDAHSGSARKPVNLTINADLLAAARKAKINLSAALESALKQQLRESRRERWRRENLPSISAYNERLESEGLFSDGLRSY
jgi:antitoxin CcdA